MKDSQHQGQFLCYMVFLFWGSIIIFMLTFTVWACFTEINNFCLTGFITLVCWYHCHPGNYHLVLLGLVRTADVNLTVLMRDSKDGSKHVTTALPGPVAHHFLELWQHFSIFCWRLVCNTQSHQKQICCHLKCIC